MNGSSARHTEAISACGSGMGSGQRLCRGGASRVRGLQLSRLLLSRLAASCGLLDGLRVVIWCQAALLQLHIGRGDKLGEDTLPTTRTSSALVDNAKGPWVEEERSFLGTLD